MPQVRIDMHRSLEPMMGEMSKAILRGMVRGFGMDVDDLFQIFRLHDKGELVFSKTFPNQARDDIIFIELLAQHGYPDEIKQQAMAAIVAELSNLGLRQDNVLQVIVEVHGQAWFAPEPA